MNSSNKIFRIICAVLFVAFAAISCWATVGSIHLSFPEIPVIIFYVAVIGIFVLTSYLTKIIVSCFNPDVYLEHRNLTLVSSFLAFVLLWLCFSMPTNTHTFFYKKMSRDIARSDLGELRIELGKLTDAALFSDTYDKNFEKRKADIRNKQKDFEAEIDDFEKLGHGKLAEEKLQKIEQALGVKRGTFERKHFSGVDDRTRTLIKQYYDNLIKDKTDVLEQEHKARLAKLLQGFDREASSLKRLQKEIDKTLEQIDNPYLNNNDVLLKATILSNEGRTVLRSRFGFLNSNNSFKEGNTYTLERLRSITKVWSDLFKGEFKGKNYGLGYWIMLSIIVDLSAFLFFNLAFKREE